MKKMLLSLLMTLFLQTADAQLSLAPEAGLNFANMRIGYMTNYPKGGVVHTTMRTGVSLGFIADYRFTRNFSLQPGIFFLTNGCNVTGGGYVAVNTLQIPLNIQYSRHTNGGPGFFAGFGPYVGLNLSYREKIGSGALTSYDVGNDTSSAIKPVDAGFGINAGISFSKLYFRLHGQMGFINLEPGGDAHNFARSSSLGITAGYYLLRLGKKAKK